MTGEQEVWDVAVSFASRDEGLAIALREVLQPPYRVFVYSKAQEHLAGRDGVEAFRSVFRERCTLAVVLYGLPWGETPWTRVEKTAIEELALDSGWERLLFVRLRTEEPVPKWVPKPRLHLDMVRFGLPDLAGAIKLRLAELGIEARTVSPAERAAAHERRRQFDEETVEYLRNRPGTYEAAMHELLEALKIEAAAVASSTGWAVGAGPSTLGGFAVTAQRQSVRVVSKRRYTNSVDDCYLEVLEYDGPLTIAEVGKQYWTLDEPKHCRSHRVALQRLPELGWCWEVGSRVLPPSGAAAAILELLLDRIDAARKRR
jgi:hypothetical protein